MRGRSLPPASLESRPGSGKGERFEPVADALKRGPDDGRLTSAAAIGSDRAAQASPWSTFSSRRPAAGRSHLVFVARRARKGADERLEMRRCRAGERSGAADGLHRFERRGLGPPLRRRTWGTAAVATTNPVTSETALLVSRADPSRRRRRLRAVAMTGRGRAGLLAGRHRHAFQSKNPRRTRCGRGGSRGQQISGFDSGVPRRRLSRHPITVS